MKKVFVIILVSFMVFTNYACPTCIGRIKPASVPFFHKEFHQSSKLVNKDLYVQEQFQRLLQQSKGKQ